MWPIRGASLLRGNATVGPWLYMTAAAHGYSAAPVTHLVAESRGVNGEARETQQLRMLAALALDEARAQVS